MRWNYRVVKHTDPSGSVYYQIHEVYYRSNGRIEGWSELPVEASASSIKELQELLSQLLIAASLSKDLKHNGHEILNADEIGKVDYNAD